MTSPETMVQIKKNHRIVSHDTFYLNCTNGSAPLIKGLAIALDQKYFYTTSPEPLVQILNNFTELCLMMSSIIIAQMVLLH